MNLLEQLVEIESPTGSTDRVVDFLIKETEELGFESYKDEAGNFICEKGHGDTILLLGHIDTVPGRIPVRIEDGKLYGRGSVDAKGAFAAFIEAASTLDFDNRIVIAGACDEEGESRGVRHIMKTLQKPEAIVIGEPSGWQGITLGYKGSTWVDYRMEKPLEHTAGKEPNSKECAIEFFNKLKNFCQYHNKGKSLFQRIDVCVHSIASQNLEFSEKTQMRIQLRTPVDFDEDEFQAFIEDDPCASFIVTERAVRAEKKNRLVRAFLKAIREEGGDPRFKLKTGTSDMNVVQGWKCPILAYGPGDSSLDHTPNENIDLKEYKKGVEVLKRALLDL